MATERTGGSALLGHPVLRSVGLYAATFAGALVLVGALVELTGGSFPEVLRALHRGSLGSGEAIGLTIDETVPVLIVALGFIVAATAGIINIGMEGQVLIGGLAGAAVALRVGVPAPLMIPATLLAAAAGGALWAGIAALLRFTRNVDVVISTLLLNLVAIQVVSFAVGRQYLLQERVPAGSIASPASDRIPTSARLPLFGSRGGFHVSSGLLIALAILVLVGVIMKRSRWGFRLRMLGMNATAARRAGIRAAVAGGGALMFSGAAAGLAGGVVLSDRIFRIQSGFSNNLGFNGLLVALIARQNAWAAVPAAALFGILRAGGGFVAATGVPRYVIDVMQALVVLAALLPPLLQERSRRRAATRIAHEQATEPVEPVVEDLEVVS